jgi:hypothetical protein
VGQILTYVLCYLFWIVSVGRGVLDMLLIRELLGRLSVLLTADMWVSAVVDKFALLILGLAWLAFAIASENYYRKGVGAGDLVRRFGRVMAAELAVPAVAYVVPFLIP